MDRENVITEIEDALSGNLAKAGHVYRMSLNGLKDKALKDALALLKEQEAIEPKKTDSPEESEYCCGICGYPLWLDELYCAHCGRPILWEGR